MAIKIQIRRDTASNWAERNPILAQGEVGWEIGTDNFKIGDGVKTWNALPYIEFGKDPIWGDIEGSIENQTDLMNLLNGKQDTISDLETIRSKATSALQQADIINNVTSTATNKALSANQGKVLQDQIDNLNTRGKYLSIWDCTTGLAMDEPPVNPYTIETGSYFIVGKIASAGGTNYRPDGGTYDKDVPSTVVETENVQLNATYYWDGTQWRLVEPTVIGEVSFASLSGQPTDNTNLANALNDKYDADNPSGFQANVLEGVQVAGTDLEISNKKVNIPKATNSALGVVKQGNTNETGISVDTDGILNIFPASSTRLSAKTGNAPVVSSNLDYAVKVGVTTNSQTLTDTEKQTAGKWLGVVNGVQLNGTDLTPDETTNKVNIPKATTSALGVVQGNASAGISINSAGVMSISKASDSNIEQKSSNFLPIVPTSLDKAIMEGLGNNSLTWTDAYKQSARNTIGASQVVIKEYD